MKATEKKIDKDVDRYIQGIRGEEKIARLLSQLEEKFYLIHDVMNDRGNIDRIVVARVYLHYGNKKSARQSYR